MKDYTYEQLMDIEVMYDEMFKESRESYVSGAIKTPLSVLVGGEKGAAYEGVYPITEELSNLMKIQDMGVKAIALLARYYECPPNLNPENKFEFVSLCAEPTEFLKEHKDFLPNYSFISNYIDEVIACEHIEHDLYDVNKQMVVDGLLPQCFEIVGAKKDKEMQKTYLEFLSKYSTMQNEYSLAAKKLFGGPTGPAGPTNA